MTKVEPKSEFDSTKDTTYLALTGELWGVFREDFGENWSRYNGTALYISGWSKCIYCVQVLKKAIED